LERAAAMELSIQDQTKELGKSIDEIRVILNGITLQLLLSLCAGFAFLCFLSSRQAVDFFHWRPAGRFGGTPSLSSGLVQWVVFGCGLVTAYFFHLRITLLIRLLRFKRKLERKFGFTAEKNYFEPNWILEWRIYSLNEPGGAPKVAVRPFGKEAVKSLVAYRVFFLFFLLTPVFVVLAAAGVILPVNFLLGIAESLVALGMACEILALLWLTRYPV
jgi:hypothetical protein